MGDISNNTNDNEMIEKTVQFYIDGAKSGKGDDMKPASTQMRRSLVILGMTYLPDQYKSFLTGMIKMDQQLNLKQKYLVLM